MLRTRVRRKALAAVVVNVIDAGASVPARQRLALVDVGGALLAREPGAGAVARVAVETVHAHSAVLARLRLQPCSVLSCYNNIHASALLRGSVALT